MRFHYKKIRSTAAAALLSSLASLALAPGLLLDANRSGAVLPPHAVKSKPHMQVPATVEVATQAFAVSMPDEFEPALDIGSAPAHDQTAETNKPVHGGNVHTGFPGGSFAVGSGWRTHGNTATRGIDMPTTTAAINQTFVPTSRSNTPTTPDNGSPLQLADDESSDATPEDKEPGQTSDETDFADAGDHGNLNNGNSSDRPHLPVATVPEPSSLALLSVGIVGLLICRHRSVS